MQQPSLTTELISTGLLVKTVPELSLARDITAVMHIVRCVARKLGGGPCLKDSGNSMWVTSN